MPKSIDQIIKYNKIQARKFGWDPSWFDHDAWDYELVEKIKQFQDEQGLSTDGMCGPGTYRRLWTEREDDHSPATEAGNSERVIIHNGKQFPIYWNKVRLWSDHDGLGCKSGTYTSYAGRSDRSPDFFVTHWDVCLSAKSCANVLSKRGISVHFCIDNDGTIYQLLDTQHAAWHAGGRTWNHSSIGVEVSDAYSLKYQSWYEKKGFGKRPIWDDAKVHGKSLKPFLGFYDVQIDAIAALWEATSRACDIPLEVPSVGPKVDPRAQQGSMQGYCCHYHLTTRKIDCAGLDMDLVLQKAIAIRKERG